MNPISLFCKYMINTVLCVCFAQKRNINFCVSNEVKEFEWSQEHVPAGRPGKNIFYPFTQILPWLAWTALCQALWYNTILWRVIRIIWSVKISAVFCGTLMCNYMCSCTLESLAAVHHVYCVSGVGLNRHAACSWSTYRARQKSSPIRSIADNMNVLKLIL